MENTRARRSEQGRLDPEQLQVLLVVALAGAAPELGLPLLGLLDFGQLPRLLDGLLVELEVFLLQVPTLAPQVIQDYVLVRLVELKSGVVLGLRLVELVLEMMPVPAEIPQRNLPLEPGILANQLLVLPEGVGGVVSAVLRAGVLVLVPAPVLKLTAVLVCHVLLQQQSPSTHPALIQFISAVPAMSLQVLALCLLLGTVQMRPGLPICSSGETVQIGSTGRDGRIEIVISIEGTAVGRRLGMVIGGGSSGLQRYGLRVEQEQIVLEGDPQGYEVIFSYRQGSQYLIAIAARIQDKQAHFIPLTLECQHSHHTFMLPLLDITISSIPLNSLLRCHRTLVSAVREGAGLVLHLFTLDSKHSIWELSGWHHTWRHYHADVYFGGARNDEPHEQVWVKLVSGWSCAIEVARLPGNSLDLQLQPYFTIRDLVESVPELKVRAQLENILQQL